MRSKHLSGVSKRFWTWIASKHCTGEQLEAASLRLCSWLLYSMSIALAITLLYFVVHTVTWLFLEPLWTEPTHGFKARTHIGTG